MILVYRVNFWILKNKSYDFIILIVLVVLAARLSWSRCIMQIAAWRWRVGVASVLPTGAIERYPSKAPMEI